MKRRPPTASPTHRATRPGARRERLHRDPCPAGFPRGSSLIELAIALGIAASLAVLAMPSYHDWIADYRLLNHAREIAGSMNVARTEAVRRGFRVNLCKSPDRRQCATAGGWGAGFIVYVDANDDGSVGAGESILRVSAPASSGITVSANRPVADYVSYTSTGTTRLANGALQMGTLTVCSSGRAGVDVVLAHSGRVRIQRSAARCP